jgi:hypothetical protein
VAPGTRASSSHPRASPRRGRWTPLGPAAVVAAIAALAIDLAPAPRAEAPRGATGASPVVAAPGVEGTTRGAIESPTARNVVADAVALRGWAADPRGIARVDIDIDGRGFAARTGLGHPAVAGEPLTAAPPPPAASAGGSGGPSNGAPQRGTRGASGFAYDADLAGWPLERHEITAIATTADGTRTALGHRSVVSPATMHRWSRELDAAPALARRDFRFLMATSALTQGGAKDVEREYAGLVSRTQSIGISVPILYMRATKGAAGDFAFDPAFDLARRCRDRPVVDDNLDEVIAWAIDKRVAVNFILNGGIWADASCYSAAWDLTTHLELDPAHCQWDQHDAVLPGDYRKGLVGSTDSPQLSRSLTYNVYDRTVRTYKRRNLTAAAAVVARFARAHPELFVGVSLDADTYMNPFVEGGHHYDYNPGMLRQFREWLQGSGPYAGHPVDGAPDLSAYRRKRPLTLADVNRLAHAHWTTWSQVDPPRTMPGYGGAATPPGVTPFWQDPWYREWDTFRKHVVQLHYAELAQWAHAAGIPADRIFTAQAVTAHDPGGRPVATYVTSPPQLFDSAGVSIEGARPREGHVGVILYGPSAENAITMETGHSLFATIGRFDDAWAVAEMNAADLRHPDVLPTYAQSYHAFRDAFNFDARQVSLMAWNGSHGYLAGRPGYVAYTSWRGTPGEQAMMDFLASHADVPRGARLWTFGSPRLADTDGWTATLGTVEASHGGLVLHPANGRIVLRSPGDQLIRPREIARALLAFDDPATIRRIAIRARGAGDAAWTTISRGATTRLALDWPASWHRNATIVEAIEIDITFGDAASAHRLARVLLYPRG